MKKLTRILLPVMLIALLIGAGCGKKKYNIIKDADEYLIDSCPDKAAAGETVTVTTAFVTDADLYLDVIGAEVEKKEEGVYVFVMPDHDVTVHVYIDTSGYDGA